jgi:hypothetical protein
MLSNIESIVVWRVLTRKLRGREPCGHRMNRFNTFWVGLLILSNGFVVVRSWMDPGFVMNAYFLVHTLLFPVAIVALVVGFAVSLKRDVFSFRLLAWAVIVLGVHLCTVWAWFEATAAI